LGIDSAAASESQGKLTNTSLGLRLRQDCRLKRFVSYFTRCLWSVDLRKKLPNIKH